jgi:hypothetical protein
LACKEKIAENTTLLFEFKAAVDLLNQLSPASPGKEGNPPNKIDHQSVAVHKKNHYHK